MPPSRQAKPDKAWVHGCAGVVVNVRRCTLELVTFWTLLQFRDFEEGIFTSLQLKVPEKINMTD